MTHTNNTNLHAPDRGFFPPPDTEDYLHMGANTEQIAWYVVAEDDEFDRSEEALGFSNRRAEAEAFAAGLRAAGVEHVGVYSFDMNS